MFRRTMLVGLAAAGLVTGAPAKDATFGYQLIYRPWALPITQPTFEKEMGYDIR